MDNLTHSLVGALIGQPGLKRKTGLAMPALIIGANIPDIDATCTIYGVESLAMRRGLTHGPIAWVLLPLALAAILYGWDRWQAKRGKRPEGRLPVRFGWLYALAFIGCLTHPALDWMNSYGIRLLEPFSHRWFYGDVLFIIDIWLWIGLGLATWFSLRRERRGGEWRRSGLYRRECRHHLAGRRGHEDERPLSRNRHWQSHARHILAPPAIDERGRRQMAGGRSAIRRCAAGPMRSGRRARRRSARGSLPVLVARALCRAGR